ncbi:MAG: hypothetical protein ABIC40_07450 [bacterium]
MRNFLIITGILLFMAITACSNSPAPDPVNPQLPELQTTEKQVEFIPDPGHSLLGLFSVTADLSSGEVVAVPLRGAMGHINAIRFLEPPNGTFLKFSSATLSGNTMSVDVTIQHPFPGALYLSGFDVKGIIIGPADYIDPVDQSRVWAGGTGGLRLLNADGWTRWWNPTEFPENGSIFCYHNGNRGVPNSIAKFNARIMPYKVFAESLGPNQSISGLFDYPIDHPKGRAVFNAGGLLTRHYDIAFPIDSIGNPIFIFNYAIDACHKLPPGYKPGQYIEVPDDFPPEANQAEPFVTGVVQEKNTLYITPQGCVGGSLNLNIHVSDWQAIMNGTSIADQVAGIELTSPSLFIGSRKPVLVSDWSGAAPFASYKISMDGLSPDSLQNQQILVSIASSEGDYKEASSSYNGFKNHTESFYVINVLVSSSSPPGTSGFALNPLAPWPKHGGTIHNSNTTISTGPSNPKSIWIVPELWYSSEPVVDPENRVFAARLLPAGGLNLLVFDKLGSLISDVDYPDFKPRGSPILVGCSLLWTTENGDVTELYQDGSSELLFSTIPGPGPTYFGGLNVDNQGHGFVHGPASIQCFDQYGGTTWVRYGAEGYPVMFLGAPTVGNGGRLIIGKMDIEGGPLNNYELWGLTKTGGIDWIHKPTVSNGIAKGIAADTSSEQVYYTIDKYIVALSSSDGQERWSYKCNNYMLETIAIGPSGKVYSAETSYSGGSCGIYALDSLGKKVWYYPCDRPIQKGPIVDSAGYVYFVTDIGEVYGLNANGTFRWKFDLNGIPQYIAFGPEKSLLVGLSETSLTSTMICLRD